MTGTPRFTMEFSWVCIFQKVCGMQAFVNKVVVIAGLLYVAVGAIHRSYESRVRSGTSQ